MSRGRRFGAALVAAVLVSAGGFAAQAARRPPDSPKERREAASHRLRRAGPRLPRPELWQVMPPLPAPSRRLDPAAPVVDVAAAAASDVGGQSAELDPTIDVQINQEILDKANELGTVSAMFDFVRNECRFQAYYGSRKGSIETLRQRAGNDYDLASLLIALLRAKGIPARYAEGSVEMPVARATSWLGVDDGHVAASILYTHGMEGVAVTSSGGGSDCCSGHSYPGCEEPAVESCVCALDSYCCDTAWDATCVSEVTSFSCGTCEATVVAVRAHRVWVEVWAARGKGSPTWVPLDPAFHQSEIRRGLDVPEAMGLDAQAFVDEYVDPVAPGVTLPRPESVVELLEGELQDWLDANQPGTALDRTTWTVGTLPEALSTLPAALPYTVRSRDGSFTEIPAARRYRIRFHLHDGAVTMIDHTLDLPDIARKRVSIDYVGATAADEATIDSYGGLYQTPPSLVTLRPVLRVDGETVATGATGIGMGLVHESDVHFLAAANGSGLPANVVPAIYNTIVAGAGQVVAFSIDGAGDRMLAPPPADDLEGMAALRHDTAIDYLTRVHAADLRLGQLLHAHVTNDVADAIVENVVSVTYGVGGVPQTFTWKGLRVDADRSVLGVWPVDRMDAPGEEPKEFLILSGAEGSLQESMVYEDAYGQDSVSTTKILELASDAGMTIYKRWSSLPLPANTQPASVRSALESAILAGRVVTFPRDPMTIGSGETGSWTGTGWIDMDPADGAAGYIISGGNNGGATVETWPPEFVDLSEGDREIVEVTIEIVTPAHDSPDGSAVFPRDPETILTFEYRIHVRYDDGSTKVLPGGTGTYKKETRNTTHTFAPNNYTFTVWVGRTIWWFFNTTIAEAHRQVSIVGVLVRGEDTFLGLFGCGKDPARFVPILPAASAGWPGETLQACVYPERNPTGGAMASSYAWGGGGGPSLSFTLPGAQQTRAKGTGVPSAALDDQTVDLQVGLPGGKSVRGRASFDFSRGGADKDLEMTTYQVAIELPSPPPLNVHANAAHEGNEFTFTAGSDITLRAKAAVAPAIQQVKDHVNEKLRWDIDDLSTFLGFGGWSWTDGWGFFGDGGQGHGIDTPLLGTENGLPDKNEDLGAQDVRLQIELTGTLYEVETRQAEFLFPRLERNHPGWFDSTPNWFYYWKDGDVCGITDSVEYDGSTGAFGYYVHGENHINVGNLCQDHNTGPENYFPDAGSGFPNITVTGTGIGPACCAETIAHEFRHKHYYETWNAQIAAAEADGENDGDPMDDPDNDGIPNSIEPGYDGIGSDPNDPDTYNMGGGYAGYGDNEVRARNYELLHNIPIRLDRDFADPGSNSNPPFI